MKKVLVVAVALTLILSASAFAGANAGVGKVSVAVEAYASNRACAAGKGVVGPPLIATCADIMTTYPGYNVDAFPVFYDLVEYQGFDYSMSWVSAYSGLFTSCSDLTIGSISNPGDGVSHAWYDCQPGPVVITGWIWLYSYGMVCVTPHPEAGGPNIGDCGGVIDLPVYNTCAGTYGYIGDDPCDCTGTEPSTWGSIKGMFE